MWIFGLVDMWPGTLVLSRPAFFAGCVALFAQSVLAVDAWRANRGAKSLASTTSEAWEFTVTGAMAVVFVSLWAAVICETLCRLLMGLYTP